MRVLHVISGLNIGGAERTLARVVLGSVGRADHRVVSLGDTGPIGRELTEQGVPVNALGMRRLRPDPRALRRIVELLRAHRPEVVQTWLYHADLVGGLAARRVGLPVVWGLRNSDLSLAVHAWHTVALSRVCAALSWTIPTQIVCNGEDVRRAHRRIGYTTAKMVVIANGFDTTVFAPDVDARSAFRAEVGASPDDVLIAYVARADPQKDHATFLHAASGLRARVDGPVRFVLCGPGVTRANTDLIDTVKSSALEHVVHVLGERADIARVYAGCDIAVSSSRIAEGVPNAIGEAMACGLPCVVTDVGDSARLVGGTGRVVPPRNAAALADALASVVRMTPVERACLGAQARERIRTSYNFGMTVDAYLDLWRRVAGAGAHHP